MALELAHLAGRPWLARHVGFLTTRECQAVPKRQVCSGAAMTAASSTATIADVVPTSREPPGIEQRRRSVFCSGVELPLSRSAHVRHWKRRAGALLQGRL
jgi:hypothetical protein